MKNNLLSKILSYNIKLTDYLIVFSFLSFFIAVSNIISVFDSNIKESNVFAIFFTILFSLISIIHIIQIILNKKKNFEEIIHFQNYLILSFYTASFFLLSMILSPFFNEFANYVWHIGIIFQIIFTLFLLSFWLNKKDQNIEMVNPLWIAPILGYILAPITYKGEMSNDILLFLFASGFSFLMIICVMIMYRVFFIQKNKSEILPMLFFPPAVLIVASISYTSITGSHDIFSKIILYSSLFNILLFIFQPSVCVPQKWSIMHWIYPISFSLITFGCSSFYKNTSYSIFEILSWMFISISFMTIIIAITQTIKGKK